MASDEGTMKATKEAVTDNKRRRYLRKPGVKFSLVGLSYMLVLAAFCIGLYLVMWLKG